MTSFINTGGLMRISEIFLLENLSINVPYHRLTMTILGKFFSGVPQIREPDGDSKKNI
jgi:hypothetical protein